MNIKKLLILITAAILLAATTNIIGDLVTFQVQRTTYLDPALYGLLSYSTTGPYINETYGIISDLSEIDLQIGEAYVEHRWLHLYNYTPGATITINTTQWCSNASSEIWYWFKVQDLDGNPIAGGYMDNNITFIIPNNTVYDLSFLYYLHPSMDNNASYIFDTTITAHG